MRHTIELNDRELSMIVEVLKDRLEEVEEDIEHYEKHPEELLAETEPGEEPLTIADYEHYRDEVQSLLSTLPDPGED